MEFFFKNHMKPINTLSVENEEFLNVEANNTYCEY
jgi:hypothetical protein